MQTFFTEKLCHGLVPSIRQLDPVRINNQINEAEVLYNGKAWMHHPAALMWRGYEHGLAVYGLACCIARDDDGARRAVWQSRVKEAAVFPAWCNADVFVAAHRQNLVRKGLYFPLSTAGDIYVWPLRKGFQWIMRRKQVGASKYMSSLEPLDVSSDVELPVEVALYGS